MINFIFVQANLFIPDEELVSFLTEKNNLVWVPESDHDRIPLLMVGGEAGNKQQDRSYKLLVCDVAALLFIVSLFVLLLLLLL